MRFGIFRCQEQELDASVLSPVWRTPEGELLQIGQYYCYATNGDEFAIISEDYDTNLAALDGLWAR
jgi:hypothetical protein